MKTKQVAYKTMLAAAGAVLLLFLLFVFPVTVQAAADSIENVDITVALREDGSADITEVLEVSIGTGTEYYIGLPNLDNQEISNFTVTDESGRVFTDVGSWNSDLTREEKAGKSGLIKTGNKYELCWGFGDYGTYTYTLTYHITNVVKGYQGADMMTQVFVPEGSNDPKNVHITVEYPGTDLSRQNTGVWVFGFSADYGFEGGKIEIQSDQAMDSTQFAGVMTEFDKGMFSPADTRSRSAKDVKSQAFEGSDYGAVPMRGWVFWLAMIAFLVAFFVCIGLFSRRGTRLAKPPALGNMKPSYRNVPYSRELPFSNSLPGTYTRLRSLKMVPNEGAIVGALLLKWIYAGQVEVASRTAKGTAKNGLVLHKARPEMEKAERSLYSMLAAAAGRDGILQAEEFEKWSKRHFAQVRGWLKDYQDLGLQALQQMGAVETKTTKVLGIFPSREMKLSLQGDALTKKMFGFRKYLQEFTIINEREAREVQLWNAYLVYAQLFGIAEAVAKQFKKLYPKYFQGEAPSGGRPGPVDVDMALGLSSSFGYTMSRGYHAGVTAHETRASGGGGHSSLGGGGGFSGGGGGGGMGSR